MAGALSEIYGAHLAGHRELFARLDALGPELLAAAEALARALAAGHSVWLAGNGGSAADAQHIAAEMEGRLEAERPARAVHTLGANSSTLTSVGNDYGFDAVYARQVAGFAVPGDQLVLISTSGRSPNLLRAAEAARARGVQVLGLLGKGGGPLAPLCDRVLLVPSDDTQWIQEAHILLGHVLCKLLDRLLAEAPADGA
ncbi:MAG: SIS domain-containing protein [Candidatus Krumholzibacteriia bacterium]|nr:SIS domain-containing protein [bacterium]MCB9514824.1 SIS domain-containing protein [Candidatus Latescibacterota bacterium]